MKLKNILVSGLSLVLVAAIAISGTVAYLTSEDSDVNVMTLGNVQIAQHEYQRAEGVTHNATASKEDKTLVDFEQGQPLYPAVPSGEGAYAAIQDKDNGFKWGDYVYSGTAWNGLWDDSKLANVMDKMVFVENTGKTDAYVRTIIAYECPNGMTVGDAGAGDNIGINYNALWTEEEVGKINVDGVEYAVYSYTYTVNGGVLAAGNTAHPSLLQVVMNHEMDNEDVAKFGDTYEILVLSQAVQTAGFPDATTALDTAFGEPAKKAAEWFGGVAENIYINEVLSQNFDATQKVVIDGEGKEIFSYIDEELINWGEAGNKPNYANVFTNATVSNISFTGTMMPVMSGYWDGSCDFDNTFNNVNIVGIESVGNAAGFSPAMIIYGDATLNNCNIYGTTTETEGTKLYDAMTQIGHTTINGGKIGNFYMANAGTTLTVNGAQMDSIYAAGRKAMIINIGEGSVIGTITLPKQATLTIAEGATVNTIICNGVTYTQAEWMTK